MPATSPLSRAASKKNGGKSGDQVAATARGRPVGDPLAQTSAGALLPPPPPIKALLRGPAAPAEAPKLLSSEEVSNLPGVPTALLGKKPAGRCRRWRTEIDAPDLALAQRRQLIDYRCLCCARIGRRRLPVLFSRDAKDGRRSLSTAGLLHPLQRPSGWLIKLGAGKFGEGEARRRASLSGLTEDATKPSSKGPSQAMHQPT